MEILQKYFSLHPKCQFHRSRYVNGHFKPFKTFESFNKMKENCHKWFFRANPRAVLKSTTNYDNNKACVQTHKRTSTHFEMRLEVVYKVWVMLQKEENNNEKALVCGNAYICALFYYIIYLFVYYNLSNLNMKIEQHVTRFIKFLVEWSHFESIDLSFCLVYIGSVNWGESRHSFLELFNGKILQ